jgi:hypothetical protein
MDHFNLQVFIISSNILIVQISSSTLMHCVFHITSIYRVQLYKITPVNSNFVIQKRNL